MIKKIILFSSILISYSSTQAQPNANFREVSDCDSDLFNGNFCSKSNISRYKDVLKTSKANFNHKFILLNTGTLDSLELIALDTQTGIGYPLNYQFTGWEDNNGNLKKKPFYTFSLNDSRVCLMGSQYDGDHPGTHQTYSNIRNCFHIKKDDKYTSFESTYIDLVQYEYNVQKNVWVPYSN